MDSRKCVLVCQFELLMQRDVCDVYCLHRISIMTDANLQEHFLEAVFKSLKV